MAELDKIINYCLSSYDEKYNINDKYKSLINETFINKLFKIYKQYNPNKPNEIKKYWYHQKNIYIKCECGANIKALSYKQHIKTDKHINFMFDLELKKYKK